MVKINDEIRHCLCEILQLELHDPRISSITSVLRVKTSSDLEHCLVYVSVLDEKKDETIKTLNNASGFIRKLIAQKLNLRLTPEFKFILDDSIEYSIKINDLLNKIK
jgi:ribosome-binding factor A